jgi:hypothetical protein
VHFSDYASATARRDPIGNPPVAAHRIEFNDTKPAVRRNAAMPVMGEN